MEIRRLLPADRKAFALHTQTIIRALPTDEWLIPLNDDEAERIFAADSTDYLLGIFIGEKLIATAGLFVDTTEFMEMPECQDVDARDTREIGECMVLPHFRGAGLMMALCKKLIEYARSIGVSTIFATAHPDNAASQHSLAHLGFKEIKQFTRRGVTRSLLRADLYAKKSRI